MSTLELAKPKTTLPPLVSGEHLDQPTFHERYEAMPDGTWAELVGGMVYMPSPMRNEHGEHDEDVAVWIGLYKRSTKGLRSGKNSTVILDEIGETQPDGHLRIPEQFGGQTRIVQGFIVGAAGARHRNCAFEPLVRLEPEEGRLRAARAYANTSWSSSSPTAIHWFIRRGSRLRSDAARPGWNLPLQGLSGLVARSRSTLASRHRPAG